MCLLNFPALSGTFRLKVIVVTAKSTCTHLHIHAKLKSVSVRSLELSDWFRTWICKGASALRSAYPEILLDRTCYPVTFDMTSRRKSSREKSRRANGEKLVAAANATGIASSGDPRLVAWQPGQPNLIGNSLRPGLPFHQTKFLTPPSPFLSSHSLRRDSAPAILVYHPIPYTGCLI